MQMGLGYQPRSPALVDNHGNAILLNGVRVTANREIGVPGFQRAPSQINFGFQF